MFRSSAWPLAGLYAALIAFASLFPFEGWRAQGLAFSDILLAPLPPQYWTWFDVNVNVAGYVPLGLLLGIGLLRGGWSRWWVVVVPLLVGGALSLCMEWLQLYLPRRVPSNLDWLLNTLGCWVGGVLVVGLDTLGAVQRWSEFRARWFVPHSHGGVALLLLWPWALLFPAALPFGLGQMWDRWYLALAWWVSDSSLSAWLPLREAAQLPLTPAVEVMCVALGLLVPCLLAYALIPSVGRRCVAAVLWPMLGVGVTALSCALGYGPSHAWAWLGVPAQLGVILGWGAALALLWLPRRWCLVLLLMAVMLQLDTLNEAPASAYFAQTLQLWEQGRFARFYGVGQWLGWLWPHVVLLYAAWLLSVRGQRS